MKLEMDFMISQLKRKMKFAIGFLMFLSFFACSTVREIKKDSTIPTFFPGRNSGLQNLSLKTSISVNANETSNAATAKLMLANLDSISVTMYGPFGLLIGKMYADTNNLVFYNSLTNQAIEGKPTEENMKAAIMLPLTYYDFLRLIRCETPGAPEDFSLENQINDGELLYKNDKNNAYVEYAVISKQDNQFTQYQRKLRDGTMVLHVFFTNYQRINNINYPMKHVYKFPGINVSLTLEVDDIEVNTGFEKPFSFRIPANIERIKLNK